MIFFGGASQSLQSQSPFFGGELRFHGKSSFSWGIFGDRNITASKLGGVVQWLPWILRSKFVEWLFFAQWHEVDELVQSSFEELMFGEVIFGGIH